MVPISLHVEEVQLSARTNVIYWWRTCRLGSTCISWTKHHQLGRSTSQIPNCMWKKDALLKTRPWRFVEATMEMLDLPARFTARRFLFRILIGKLTSFLLSPVHVARGPFYKYLFYALPHGYLHIHCYTSAPGLLVYSCRLCVVSLHSENFVYTVFIVWH
jgi:hypothetical protein